MTKTAPPEIYAGLPVATAATMREIDRIAEEKFGLPAATLMENAGREIARETVYFLKNISGAKLPGRVAAFCGRGFNGGDGLCAARFLKQAGLDVVVFICPPKKDGNRPGRYPQLIEEKLSQAQSVGIDVAQWPPSPESSARLKLADAALDALLGTGSSGKPAGDVREMIQAQARLKKPIIAADVPSGIHPDTGYHSGVYVTAALTLALGFAKRGILAPHAAQYAGEIKVLDIGYPTELVRQAASLSLGGAE
ncbi:MAG: NAD(P)H-hydrate epimerase [Elusimicrobiota bacterium]